MIAKQVIFKDDESRRGSRGGGKDTSQAEARQIGKSLSLPRGPGKGYRASRKGPARGPRPPALSIGQHRQHFTRNIEYLVRGDKMPDGSRPFDQDGNGRVSEIHLLNIPGQPTDRPTKANDLRRAGEWMSQTASQNTRIADSAAWHFVLGAAPEDTETIKQHPDFWKDTAARALKTLGMEHHQAALVVHQDAGHPHAHLLVNRVDPISQRAMNPWNPVIRLERTMREIEKEYGLHQVQGRHVDAQTLGPIPRSQPIPKLRSQLDRIDEEQWVRQIRKKLKDKPFSTAKSWGDLEKRLKKDGLRLQAEGRGLQLTGKFKRADGQEVNAVAKLSKIAGKAGNREALEARFGRAWAGYLSADVKAPSQKPQMQSLTPPTSSPSPSNPRRLNKTPFERFAKFFTPQTTLATAQNLSEVPFLNQRKDNENGSIAPNSTSSTHQSNIKPSSVRASSQSADCVPELRGRALARDAKRREVLLSGDAFDQLEHLRTDPAARLRRTGNDEELKAVKEAEEKEKKRFEEERATFLRSLLQRPARVAQNPNLYPGAAHSQDLREALRRVSDVELTESNRITEQALQQAQARLANMKRDDPARLNLMDEVFQRQDALKMINRAAAVRGVAFPPALAVEPPKPPPSTQQAKIAALRLPHHLSPHEKAKTVSGFGFDSCLIVEVYSATYKQLEIEKKLNGPDHALARLELDGGLKALADEAKQRGLELPVMQPVKAPKLFKFLGWGID